jgi:hypothetical protein
MIYTGSSDGIWIWKIVDPDEVDIYGQKLDEIETCMGVIDEHNQEPIWSIKHHPYGTQMPLIISAGADDSVCLVKAYSEEEGP